MSKTDRSVLGIHFGNDASAALVRPDALLAAVAEERYARVKHHAGWPASSIRYCLEAGGTRLDDVGAVALAWNPALYMDAPNRRHQSWRHHTEYLSAVPGMLLPMLGGGMGESSHVEQSFHFLGGAEPLRVFYVTHHLAHAASAFFVSPFERAAILTLDGYGERTSMMMLRGEGNTLTELGRVEFPHSMGSFYAAMTQYLGFRPNSGEGKVMGLASYGQPRFLDECRRLVKLLPEGRFELDLSYFSFYLERPRRYTEKLVALLGPPREPESELSERHMDIAASLQAALEDVYDHVLAHLHAATGEDALCLAGGVTLNCVANGRALGRSRFRECFVQPAAGDGGASLGAALYVQHALWGEPRAVVQTSDCLGPDTSDAEIGRELRRSGITALPLQERAKAAAQLISQGFILGWYQGRAEFGPRALGSRSILADPRGETMKDVLNARVKFREWFRPFAPSVLEEKAAEWFDGPLPSPYMLLCHDVVEDKRPLVPAITHVDGTARIQTVDAASSPLYHQLIAEFDALTGVPMVLDTSFNIRGEPIVNTPKQALMCFLTTDLDFLFLGGFLLWKDTAACREALAELGRAGLVELPAELGGAQAQGPAVRLVG